MNMFSALFKKIVEIRNLLYDKGFLKSLSVKCWVISVGNITVGGTGKTPIVDFLVKSLSKKGFQLAVVSRGYKGKTKDFAKVDVSNKMAAEIYGDEPTWISARNPSAPVYISPNRVKGINKIIKDVKPDIVIADDAFQHRRLKRDVDIVVIDATEKKENYLYLPKGRAREGFDSVSRASVVFITKTNLVSPDVMRWIRGNVRFNKNIFEFEMKLKRIYNLLDPDIEKSDFSEVVLVSGIGKPDNFEKILENYKIRKHFKYKDHVVYDDEKLNVILDYQRHYPVLITEKDAVKLKGINGNNIWVCELEYVFKDKIERLYELICPKNN